MKKFMAVLLSMAFVMSFFMTASADNFSNFTYYVEYEDDKATVIFQSGDIGAFDFGVIYNPSQLTVEDYDYSEYFYSLADNSDYTLMHVKNDKAVDNVGTSTYVVFTGAGMDSDGDSLPCAHRDVASVTFTDIDKGDEIVVVAETARYEDVKNAVVLGADDLYEQINIADSYLLSGAVAEPGAEGEDSGSSKTWIFGVVVAAVVVVAVVLVLMSKKNKLDVPGEKRVIVEEDDDDDDDDLEDEE